MVRDLKRLADTSFDLVIIGGGIYGTTAAWDAAQRGLSVAIIDRSDWGGATSFNSFKTVHGGVRSLQSGHIAELRQFVRERRAFCRIAPHLVEPLPFIIPTYRGVLRNRWLMRAYFAVNDLLARDRNDQVDPARQLASSRLVPRDECLALSPATDPESVTGGLEWHDCQMYNSDRLTLAFLQSAVRAGTAASNYVEAISVHRHGDQVTGVTVRDHLASADFDIRARVVLNCAGPWAPALLRQFEPLLQQSLPRQVSMAMNVVTSRRLVDTHAVGGTCDGRFLFMAPWRTRVIIGTSYDPRTTQFDDVTVSRVDVTRFLSDVNRAFPRAALEVSDIDLIHRGVLPARDGTRGHGGLLKRSIVRDHRSDGVNGLVSVLGVRYTTARDCAQQAIDAVFGLLGKRSPACRTAVIPLVGGDIPDVASFLGGARRAAESVVDPPAATRIARSYGSTYGVLVEALRKTPEDRQPLGATCSVTRGEVRHAVRNEMAVKLTDALLRRTEAGSAGHPGDDAVQTAGRLMAKELGWAEDRLEEEVARVNAAYPLTD